MQTFGLNIHRKTNPKLTRMAVQFVRRVVQRAQPQRAALFVPAVRVSVAASRDRNAQPVAALPLSGRIAAADAHTFWGAHNRVSDTVLKKAILLYVCGRKLNKDYNFLKINIAFSNSKIILLNFLNFINNNRKIKF